jgi:hypothetical protein
MQSLSSIFSSKTRLPASRGCFKSSARTALVWLAATLCISPFVGGFLLDRCPFRIRDPEAAASVSIWQRTNPAPQILVLGSSRLGSFVRTPELNRLSEESLGQGFVPVVNASLVCGEPITLEFVTRRLLAAGTPPQLVLLEASPDLLARDNRYFSFAITRELTARDLPKYLPDIFLSQSAVSRLLSSRLIPFFRHRNHFLGWINEAVGGAAAEPALPANAVEAHSFQFIRDKDKEDPRPPVERMRIGAKRFQSHLRKYQIEGSTSSAFESTVAMLHNRGCRIVLLEPPVSSYQRALLTDEARAQFDGFVQRLRTLYQCQIADYSERLPDSMFVDNHHANDAGSLKFTEYLASEVISPTWSKVVKHAAE